MSTAPSAAKQALRAIQDLQARLEAERRARNEAVAIIGMGARYPGAESLDAFWQLLRSGTDAVGAVPPERWDSAALYDADPAVPGKITNRRGGFLPHLDEFDAAFFGISPREAPHVDPRQRILLEIAWEALEHAGIVPAHLAGSSTGVYVATLANDYDHLLCDDLGRIEAYTGAGTANSVVANRLSYFFDLRGPSLALDTACSGSLLAVHLACESLRSGESSLALAGGVNLTLMPKSNVFFSKAGALSPGGVCRTFDQDADGMVRSDGAGIVVLKLLSHAIRDRDPIVAVIRGSAVNHDGRSNGIMAPNGAAQEAVLREAYRRAGVAPSQVQYVEAHGTATRLGDPIEVAALGAVLAPERPANFPCRLGSLKTNIGHTEAAAGVGGLIKTALALQHRQLPPSLHFERPNPLIPLGTLPFEVQRGLGPWPAPERPLIAGVSGFGFGGTNAHVVLEEAPAAAAAPSFAPPFLLPLSGRTPAALRQNIAAYLERLDTTAGDTGALCSAAGLRRAHFPHRVAVTGNSAGELCQRLAAAADRAPAASTDSGRIAFVFSGQGSHWPGMGRQLAAREPVFRSVLEDCDRILTELVSWSLLEELEREAAHSRLDDTVITQPAIFAVQCGLAALWQSWGIRPQVVVGHSLGEAAAAVTAGILTRAEAMRVVVHRSRLMKRVEGRGQTAAVALDLERARLAVTGFSGLAVAGSNGPQASVVSGDPEELAQLLRQLEGERVFARLLPGIRIAFHSPQMDSLRPELEEALADLAPRAATIPMVSTVTGGPLAGEAFDAAYWGRNLREPFLFAQATESLLRSGASDLVEISPHPVLSSAMTQSARALDSQAAVFSSLRRQQGEIGAMLASLGGLYERGAAVEWARVYPGGAPAAALPTYPWQRERYWFDQLATATDGRPIAGGHPLLGTRIEAAHSPGLSLWEAEPSPRRPAYLADHRVWGQILLPGAACLEMALEAAAQTFGQTMIEAREVTFERALLFPGEEPRRLQVVLERRGASADFQLFSRSGVTWERNAHGTVATAEPLAGGALPSVTNWAQLAPEEHYRAMSAQGLDYGPRFRGIVQLWQRSGTWREAVAELRLPEGLSARGYHMHPALLDAALQTVAAAAGYGHAYLPQAVERLQLERAAGAVAWSHARLRGEPGQPTLGADLDLYDADRVPLGRLTGLRLRLAPRSQAQSLGTSLLAEHWVALPPASSAPPPPASWLIVADGAGVADAFAAELRRRGHQPVLIPPEADLASTLGALPLPCAGAVHLCGLDASFPDGSPATAAAALRLGCGSALRLAQALLASARTPPRLLLVTRGAQAAGDVTQPQQAPLHGLSLVIAQEHPELSCTTVDLDPGAPPPGDLAPLCHALLQPDGESRVAWRDGQRFVSRLERAAPPTATPPRFDPQATYLITGGLGALGLQCARALVEHGARQLLLTGRSGARNHHQETEIAALQSLGAQVTVVAMDVVEADAVASLFERIRSGPAPLRGILHAAGVLDDGLLRQQTQARFAAVMAPKIEGAWNLHFYSRDLPLDFFVCFSSAASLVGSPGQANYAAANAFLDALAHYRRAQGLTALSLDWGAWSEGGMADSAALRGRLAARGVSLIEPQPALDFLLRWLSPEGIAGPAQIGILPTEWPKFLAQFPSVPPRLAGLAPTVPTQAAMRFRPVLDALPTELRGEALRGFVRDQLASVLGFNTAASAPITPHQRFFELGMDSLLALELRNRLEAGLELALSSTVAFDFPSVQTLGDHLLSLLPGESLDALSDSELEQMLTDEIGRGAGGGAG